ncbi:MAG: chemotaxis protein CheA [Myxococcales bacterium]|nr:chemotaxis protein CheA [Myxococcales bacterium]
MTSNSEPSAIFLEEATEHLGILENRLMEIGDNSDTELDASVMNTVFRAAHSLKGSSAIAGLSNLALVAHELEEILDALRTHRVGVTSDLIDMLLKGVDKCCALLDAWAHDVPEPDFRDLVEALHNLIEHRAEVERMADIAIDGLDECISYKILFSPLPLDASATFEAQLDAIAALGFIGESSTIPADPTGTGMETRVRWTFDLQGYVSEEDIVAAAEPYSSELELVILVVEEEIEPAGARRSIEPNVGNGAEPGGDVAASDKDAKRQRPGQASTLRVDVTRIDALMNMVGELVTVQSSIEHIVQNFKMEDLVLLQEAVEELARNTRAIQEGVLTMRMVPLEATLRRFPRMVRDLSAQLGKSVRLEMSGQETELDKRVAELLIDPLGHVVRNSLDHGIEDSVERALNGKDEQGCLSINAAHIGGEVIIEISDDGAGIDLERLRAKAESCGLIAPGEVANEQELTNLVFHPGLSTAQKVTSVSGRGVGMDVVKTNVENLGGDITVKTELGAGTKIRIALPLTMAVIDGLVIRDSHRNYVVPLANVVESLRPNQVKRRRIAGGEEVCVVRNVTTPIVRLADVLGNSSPEDQDDSRSNGGVLLVVNVGERTLAILVDEIVDQRQLLVKNLQDNFRRVPGIIGVSVMSDGSIAMIVDVVGIENLARSTQKSVLAA